MKNWWNILKGKFNTSATNLCRFIYYKITKQKLQKRWEGENDRIISIFNAIKSGNDWTVYLVKHFSHNYGDIKFIHDGKVEKQSSDVAPRDLRGINLHALDFRKSTMLTESNFDFSILNDIDFQETILTGSTFNNSSINNCNFSNANLRHCIFRQSLLDTCNFTHSILEEVNLKNTKLNNIILIKSDLLGIRFNSQKAFSFIYYPFNILKGTSIRNLNHDIDQDIFINSSRGFITFLKNQERISRIDSSGKFFSFMYYLLTDYGQNFKRLGFWIALLWFSFALIYSSSTLINDNIVTENTYIKFLINKLIPTIDWGGAEGFYDKLLSAFYFSITVSVTLTFGDIKPINLAAKFYVCLEVILAYILLSLFVSMIITYSGYYRSEQ